VSAVIETHNLTKRFGTFTAVNRINLHVDEGSIYAFLGPNGAGKSTTIRMLVGLLTPSDGYALVFGHDVELERERVLERIGYAPERLGFPSFLTGEQLLERTARLYGLSRIEARERARRVLKDVDLWDHASRRIGAYSHGMKRRLSLAQALVHDPPLLILDEPTSGLDPEHAVMIRDLLRGLHRGGKTVFMSTHMLAEAEKVCTHVGVILDGTLVAQGPVEELFSRMVREDVLEIEVADPPQGREWLISQLRQLDFVYEVSERDGHLLVCLRQDENGRNGYRIALSQQLTRWGAAIVEMRGRRMTLEEFYLRVLDGHRRNNANKKRR